MMNGLVCCATDQTSSDRKQEVTEHESDVSISKAHCLFGYYYTIGNYQFIFTKFGGGIVRIAYENVDINPSLKL